MTLARRVLQPLRLAAVRLVERGGRTALVALGIAAGALALAVVSAGSLIAEDRSLSRALSRLPPQERAVQAAWFGVPRETRWAELDADVRPVLREVGEGEPAAFMIYRETRVGGALVDLAAANGLERWLRLRSGRAPRECRPARCEVVQVAGRGPIPSVRGLRLVKVGEAATRSALPFGDVAAREERSPVGRALRYHVADQPPFLVAEGVGALATASPLALTYRSYGWLLPVEPEELHPWDVDGFLGRLERARSTLEASEEAFDVTAPADALAQARAEGEVAARRLLLIGGQAAALLLAFAFFAAAAMRRDVEAAWRRLTWAGAARWQLLLLVAAEAAAVAVLAAAAGWLGGTALSALVARAAGAPAQAVVAHSVLSARGAAYAALLAVGAALLLLGALLLRPARIGGRTISPADVAAFGAAAAVALAFARGEVDGRSLAASEETGAFLVLLPALIAFVAAIVAARALAPALRLLERLGRRGAVSLRLAAVSLARNPGYAAVAVAFLVVSFGLALFAELYRSTLAAGQRAQADFAVPTDFVLREDPATLVPVSETAPPGGYETLAPGAEAAEVVRLSGSVTRAARGFTLLGLEDSTLARLESWREDYADLPLAELAARIAPAEPDALRGFALPPDTDRLRIPARVEGEDVAVTASLRTASGRFLTVPLGQTRGARRVELGARVPTAARGGALVAFTFGFARDIHREPGGGAGLQEPTAASNLSLGPIRLSGGRDAVHAAVDYREWVGSEGARVVRAGPGRARLALIVSNEFPARFRLRQPTDGRPVPAVVSPGLAEVADERGVLPLGFTAQQLIVRVVGIAERFPSVYGDFAIVDRGLADAALNADRPGSAVANEIWLEADERERERAAAALARPPFDRLRIDSQAGFLADFRSDPLARGTLLALAAAAVAGLAFAFFGPILGLVADLRDERRELSDLEAEGMGPRALRRHLRLRTAGTVAFGLVGGLAAGLVLSVLVVDLVALTAGTSAPEPPLVLTVDWPVVLAALATYGLLAGAAVVATTWIAFRRPALEGENR